MIIVPLREGENIERALKKFKRKFERTGMFRAAYRTVWKCEFCLGKLPVILQGNFAANVLDKNCILEVEV